MILKRICPSKLNFLSTAHFREAPLRVALCFAETWIQRYRVWKNTSYICRICTKQWITVYREELPCVFPSDRHPIMWNYTIRHRIYQKQYGAWGLQSNPHWKESDEYMTKEGNTSGERWIYKGRPFTLASLPKSYNFNECKVLWNFKTMINSRTY